MTTQRSARHAFVSRALLATVAAAGLVPLCAGAHAAAEDPPEPDVQPCNPWVVNVPAEGHPFRESDLCEDIALLNPDPCAVAWGVETLTDGSIQWGELASTPQEPYSACWLHLNMTFNGCFVLDPQNPANRFGQVPGYPLNINLFGTSSIGDFLPPSPTLGGSSVALCPPAPPASRRGGAASSVRCTRGPLT